MPYKHSYDKDLQRYMSRDKDTSALNWQYDALVSDAESKILDRFGRLRQVLLADGTYKVPTVQGKLSFLAPDVFRANIKINKKSIAGIVWADQMLFEPTSRLNGHLCPSWLELAQWIADLKLELDMYLVTKVPVPPELLEILPDYFVSTIPPELLPVVPE